MTPQLPLTTEPRVWNKRDPNVPADAVYVGRPTKWGNPFKISPRMSRKDAVEMYRKWIGHHDNAGFLISADAVVELRGKHLVCWCAPLACHADILLEIANANG